MTSRNLRSIIPTERESQRTVVQYVRMKYPDVVIFAIPNGGSRNKIEAANLKKDGVLAGVPDLFIARARINTEFIDESNGVSIDISTLPQREFKKVRINEKIYSFGLFVEMKSPKGKTSLAQSSIICKLEEVGYRVEVCYSADEAIKVIDEYLS